MLRFISSSLAGIVRTDVAVGTLSDASMYLARVASAPRKGCGPAVAGVVSEISFGFSLGSAALAFTVSGSGAFASGAFAFGLWSGFTVSGGAIEAPSEPGL